MQRKSGGNSFDRFTNRGRRVLILAQEEAKRFRHNYIGTEHLLLGLLAEGEGVAAKVLADLGIELSKVRDGVEFIIGRGGQEASGEIGLTPRAKRTIELALDEARSLGCDSIGTEHLLLGVLQVEDSIAAGVLESLGVTIDKVRAQTIEVLSGTAAPPPPAEEPVAHAPRWQYLQVATERHGGVPHVQRVEGAQEMLPGIEGMPVPEAMDRLAREGWELAGIDPGIDRTTGEMTGPTLYVFKRQP